MRGPSLNSPLEDISGELHKRMLVLLLRATYVQRTKLRSASTTRQPRTRTGELNQNDQIGEPDGPQISQPVESEHDTPLDHGIQSYARLDIAREAPVSGLLQEYRPLDDGVFEDFDDELEVDEHNKEHELVSLERMSYYSDHIHREGTHAEVQRQNHFDPDFMDGDDLMEDDIAYGTRDHGLLYHQSLFSPDGMHEEALKEDAEGLRSESPNPDGIVDLFEDGLYYLGDEEEEHLEHRIALDEIHELDLASGTPPNVARDHDVYDDEMYDLEEDRPTHIRAFGVDSDDYPFYDDDQGQVEGGFYEDPDEDCTFLTPEGHTRDELYDEAMYSMSGEDVETRSSSNDRSIGHIYDYQTDGVYTPEYTYQFDHTEEAEIEETVSYDRLARYSDDWDRVPRDHLHPRVAHLTGSMSVDQNLVGTHPSSGDAPESGVHGRSSHWNRASGRH